MGNVFSTQQQHSTLEGREQNFHSKFKEHAKRDIFKRALLIGINYIGQANELNGCINDVAEIKTFLKRPFDPSKESETESGENLRYFGSFEEQDIIVMRDDIYKDTDLFYPSKKNIIEQIKQLVSHFKDKKEGLLFIHYSGHGISKRDKSGDEADGRDELVCPVDYQKSGFISDDLLREILIDPLHSGIEVRAIYDCCHSGTILDLRYDYEVDINRPPSLRRRASSHVNTLLKRKSKESDTASHESSNPQDKLEAEPVDKEHSKPDIVENKDTSAAIETIAQNAGVCKKKKPRQQQQPRTNNKKKKKRPVKKSTSIASKSSIKDTQDSNVASEQQQQESGGIETSSEYFRNIKDSVVTRRENMLVKESQCNVILFSGCADNQYSADAYIQGRFSGAFTHAFLNAYKKYEHRTRALYRHQILNADEIDNKALQQQQQQDAIKDNDDNSVDLEQKQDKTHVEQKSGEEITNNDTLEDQDINKYMFTCYDVIYSAKSLLARNKYPQVPQISTGRSIDIQKTPFL